MSKRTDSIRSLFTAAQPPALSADNVPAPVARVSSGAVRSLRGSFSDAERENDELRRRLASGASVIEIDPDLIDPSPVADRFAEQNEAAYEALKLSMRQRGQEVPVLVRPHPTSPERYQSAYGHRRIRAARELGLSVRAVLRELTDEDLVVAQGVENSAREDLSFIERAVFAQRLENAGHDRSVVQEALSIDRAEASKLIAVARAIPPNLIERIGRAPKVGRGRWQALVEILKRPNALKRAEAATQASDFASASSDGRFMAVLRAGDDAGSEPDVAPGQGEAVAAPDGRRIAVVQTTPRETKIVIGRRTDEGFAAFLVEQLPSLFEAYAEGKPKNPREA